MLLGCIATQFDSFPHEVSICAHTHIGKVVCLVCDPSANYIECIHLLFRTTQGEDGLRPVDILPAPEEAETTAPTPPQTQTQAQIESRPAAPAPPSPKAELSLSDIRSLVKRASSANDLLSLGLDVLKEELRRRGAKCGGTDIMSHACD